MAKADTRGQKQIVEENKQTINFYSIMSSVATGIYLFFMVIFYLEQFTLLYLSLTGLTLVIYGASIACMKYMSKANYSESGQLLDGGLDLNMKDGFAEHLKDLIILTSATEILAVTSNYFWLLLFLAPIRASILIWKNFIGPWIFAEPDINDPEINEKKQRKLDRRQKRMQ